MSGIQHTRDVVVSESAASSRAARRVLTQWPTIVACGVISMLCAWGLTTTRTPQYESSTSVRIESEGVGGLLVGEGAPTDADVQREIASAITAFTLPSVRERAARTLGGSVSAADIADALSVSARPSTNIVRVAAQDPSPRRAQQIASAVTKAFIAVRIQATREKLSVARTQLSRQYREMTRDERLSVPGQQLRGRAAKLDTLIAVADGNAEIVQTARVATEPSSPDPGRDALVGLFSGLLLGVLLATLRMRLDDRLRFAGELSEIWALPVVGHVPQRAEFEQAGATMPSPEALEPLWIAQTNLRYLRLGTQVKVLMLTSASQSEGKSTMAWNLAIATATTGSSVVVVEADMRRPALSRRLGLSGAGLSEHLAGLAPLEGAIHVIPVSDGRGGVAASIDVLAAGMIPPSPTTLFDGDASRKLFDALRERYDVVIVDTPPATAVADALALLKDVDGVLIVSRLGVLRRAAYERLRDVLTGVNAPVIGQLINSEREAPAYDYSYDAVRGSQASAASSETRRSARWRRLSPQRRQS